MSLTTWLALLAAGAAQAAALAWPGPDLPGLPGGEPLPWLQVLAMAVAFGLLLQAPSARQAALRMAVFAWAWLAGTFWWLFVSMHTYGGLPAGLAVLAVLALALALAGYYAAAGALAWAWRRRPPWQPVLAWTALWTLAELARGSWFTGFPWGAIGYAHVDALAVLAPWVGVYGMGAVAAALAACLALALVSGPGPRAARERRWAARWPLWLPLVLALPLWLWPDAGPRWAAAMPDQTTPAGRLQVTLLQGNIPQDLKFDAQSGLPLALAWYRDAVHAALASPGDGPGLVVAPETAIPLLPQDLDPAYWQALQGAVQHGRSALMLGVPLGSFAEGYTNSVMAWTPEGTRYRYDKHHLVPFGEFIPPGFRWFVDLMHIPLGDFSRGPLGQPSLAWAGQRVAPNICYEDLFGEELAVSFRDPGLAPTVLVNVSNIAWFGDTVAVDQHRHISRLRALELQRPMLRATNTGATALIDHHGRVLQALPPFTRATLTGPVEGRRGLTPYARWASQWGLWPMGLACLLGLVLLGWPSRTR